MRLHYFLHKHFFLRKKIEISLDKTIRFDEIHLLLSVMSFD